MSHIIIKKTITIIFISLSLSLLSACSSQSKKVDKLGAASYNAQLGAKYLQAGRLKLANEKLEKALKQNPDSSEVNHFYAILQQRIGNNTAATKYFKKAIQINKKDRS